MLPSSIGVGGAHVNDGPRSGLLRRPSTVRRSRGSGLAGEAGFRQAGASGGRVRWACRASGGGGASSGHRVQPRMSPGWQSSTRQIEARVVNRIALACPFFRTATFAGVMPTAATNAGAALRGGLGRPDPGASGPPCTWGVHFGRYMLSRCWRRGVRPRSTALARPLRTRHVRSARHEPAQRVRPMHPGRQRPLLCLE